MRSSRFVLALPLLLAALPSGAATGFMGTGWLIGVPVPGILCTNGSGQVYLKGNVHTVRILADGEPLITGRLQAMPDVAFQPDGTRRFTGTAFSEVGEWAGTNFTATGGVWDCLYRGVTQVDGSIHYDLVGYGLGGSIDGLRTEITADRGPGGPFDPAIPYTFSSTIKPAPVNTSVVLDDFNDEVLTNKWVPWSSGTPYLTEANGQIEVRGVWNRPRNDIVFDHAGAYWPETWSVPDGQTVEWRAEVLGMNQDVGMVGMGVGTSQTRYYCYGLTGDSILLYRFTATGGSTPLFSDPTPVRQTNILLCFALTRHQSQAIITLRVEDRAVPGSVLYQTNYLDVDAMLFLSGNSVGLVTGPKPGLPSSDIRASFDNFWRGTYEVPRTGIERAVRLSWPITGQNYTPQWAPTPQGPWQAVPDQAIPGMNQVTVPTSGTEGFIQLIRTP